jgi:hypothetical protein
MSTRGRARNRDSLSALSFVADRDGKTLPKPTGDQLPRCFWNVTPTGDYERDCKIGYALGIEYLTLQEAETGGLCYLGWIVADMPRRPLTGVEVGFLTMVAYAAGAGAYRAREVLAYWEERMPAAAPS